ncbi:MAG: NfeD family protein [Armatimonadetes bacterium]|nr:NfeD family protein [Armatimonadota bacterium]
MFEHISISLPQIYLGCFFLGLFFAIGSGLMAGLGGIHGGVGAGHDMDISGGHDLSGTDLHVDVGHAHLDVDAHAADASDLSGGNQVHFSPLSPITISTFVTAFGGVGYICSQIPVLSSPFISVPLATGAGVGTSAALFGVLYKLLYSQQGSSEAVVGSLVGTEGEVIEAVTPGGLGRIAYTVKGFRYTAPARSEEDEEIARHTAVRIVRILGSVYSVRPLSTEQTRRAMEPIDEASEPQDGGATELIS